MKYYLDEAGAYVYLFTTELAADWGVIGLGEYLPRLACLLDMLEPHSEPHNFISERLRIREEECPRGWPDDPESAASTQIPKLEVHSEKDPAATKTEILHLVSDQAGVLGDKWVFHQGDLDFFPSVPHGHLKTRRPVKLDAYRGYTYDTALANTPLARETRHFIVGLWSDRRFRVFACKALDHFAACNPSFNWLGQRGILHPFRFPRYR